MEQDYPYSNYPTQSYRNLIAFVSDKISALTPYMIREKLQRLVETVDGADMAVFNLVGSDSAIDIIHDYDESCECGYRDMQLWKQKDIIEGLIEYKLRNYSDEECADDFRTGIVWYYMVRLNDDERQAHDEVCRAFTGFGFAELLEKFL